MGSATKKRDIALRAQSGEISGLEAQTQIAAVPSGPFSGVTSAIDRISGADKRREARHTLEGFNTLDFNTSGLTGSIEDGKFNLTRTPELESALGGLKEAFGQANRDIRGLLPQVRPGFGRLTEATRSVFGNQRQRFDDSRRKTLGSLREDLSRRNVLGSSFAQDSVGRVGAEFDRRDAELAAQEQESLAKSFLEELDLTTQLTERASQAAIQGATVNLNQLNFESELGSRLAIQLSSIQRGVNSDLAQLLQGQGDQATQFIADVVGFAGDRAVGGKTPPKPLQTPQSSPQTTLV